MLNRSRIVILFCLLGALGIINTKGQSMDNSKSGYAYITGVVKDFNKYGRYEDYITVQYFNWAQKSPIQYHFKIDNNGFFSDSLYLLNAQDITINYNAVFKTLFLSPNDTNNIIITGSSIKSTNNTENELLSTYFKDSKSSKVDILDASNLFKENRYKIYKDKLEQNSVFVNNNSLSEYYIQWLTNHTTLNYLNDLTNYLLSQSGMIQTDSIVMEIFDSVCKNHSEYKHNSIYHVLINNLTELVYKQVVFEGSCLRSLRKYNFKKNLDSDNQRGNKIPIQQIHKSIYLCFINSLEFIYNNKIRELLIANKYLKLYEKGNFELCIDSVLNQLNDTLVKENFLKQYRTINYSNNLTQNIIISDINEGEKLLEDIQNKYPQDVICLIFWSTWCRPCYTHMLDLEANKDKLSSKNVRFVYLCCQSKQNIWEEKIKLINVEGLHYLLNNKQYAFFSKKFNINGFPRTVLISKDNYYLVSTHNAERIINKIINLEK